MLGQKPAFVIVKTVRDFCRHHACKHAKQVVTMLISHIHTHTTLKFSIGWWFVSVGTEEGWAPCSYLERLNGKDEEETISSLGEQLECA